MPRVLNVAAAGSSFHARCRGEHPQAVFLHGFGSDLHTWDRLWDELAPSLPSLRYDLRDHGLSGAATQAFRHADDLLALLDALQIERCDLVGVSMGGAIAINFALDHPERVRNLVLISPALIAWEWSQAWRALWRPIALSARAGNLDEARRLWWQHPLFASTRASSAGPALQASIQRFPGAPWVHEHQQSALPDVDRLPALTTRTLLLTGGQDMDDFRLIAQLIEGCAADVRRIDEPALGHLLHLEDPQACGGRIAEFLQG